MEEEECKEFGVNFILKFKISMKLKLYTDICMHYVQGMM